MDFVLLNYLQEFAEVRRDKWETDARWVKVFGGDNKPAVPAE